MFAISPKTFNIDTMIQENMLIKAVAVPYFLVFLTLQVRFEMVQETCICAKVINEDPRTPSEIELRPCEEGSADDSTFPRRILVKYIEISGLCIPSYLSIRIHKDAHTTSTLLRSSHDVYS
jgi:hypothetical protein